MNDLRGKGSQSRGDVHILRRDLSRLGEELKRVADLAEKGGEADLREAGVIFGRSQKPLRSLKGRIGRIEDAAVRKSLQRQLAELETQMETIQAQIPDEMIDLQTAGAPKDTQKSAYEASAARSIAVEVQNIVGNFGTVAQEVAAARLTQDEEVIVNVEDIVRTLDGVMREFKEFKERRIDKTIQKVYQQQSTFTKRYQEWDRSAKQKEAEAKREGLDNKKKRKMEAEHHGVRNRYPLALKQFQRLSLALEQFQMKTEKQASESDAGPAQLP